MDRPSTLVAFYLPQYHPIPENNAWWGPGFTEWTNVARANPLFKGHYQPHIPGDLGFYDLRLPETRLAQAALAARYGIGAFCYYHYWFNGRQLLERPFEEVLASGKPDFPFCLCWANENWTRAWDGQSRKILLEQHYSREDDEHHFRSLLPALTDPRYLRHEDRPILLIYRARRMPDPRATMERWREMARAEGLSGLYLLRMESFPEEEGDPRSLGFDAAVEFQPEWRMLRESRRTRMVRSALNTIPALASARWKHTVLPYEAVVRQALDRPQSAYPRHPGVAPSWDNSPRRSEGALILRDAHPRHYGHWLKEVIRGQSPEYVFINAWNEWGEGCHLEPCRRWGHGFLEETLNALPPHARPAVASSLESRVRYQA